MFPCLTAGNILTVLDVTLVCFICDVLKALKIYISVDFIVQCVLLEHVMLFSYYAKTQRELKHMVKDKPTS